MTKLSRVPITISLPADLVVVLKEMAQKKYKNISEIIKDFILDYMQEEEIKPIVSAKDLETMDENTRAQLRSQLGE